MKKTHPFKAVATSVVALALLTACGGGDAERPTVDEISTVFQSEDNMLGMGLEADQADCVAEAFHSSDVSDETLRALVDNDTDYEGSDEDAEALTSISTDSVAECVAG